ncbi:hypothetical protein ANCCEY_14797, partial [Ancylostoma ceylanicum]
KHIKETTKDYERYLAEMQQRIIDRPLIMEQQSIIAQKQKFARKFEERMAEVEKIRNDSDLSAGTYSVKSKTEQFEGEEGYEDADFESEEEASNGKKRSGSTSSSSSSSTSSSTKRSGSSTSSSTSSNLSRSSKASSKGSRGNDPI